MTDPLDTPHLEGWPEDPTVTYDPGRTIGVTQAESTARPAAAEALQPGLAPWILTAPGEPSPPGSSRPVYRLEKALGSGGFGEVWQAVQTSLERVVALKRPHRPGTPAPETRSATARLGEHLFRQEALVTAALDHPAIVPVHDLGQDENGEPVLAMKLVRGRLWKDVFEEDLATLSVAELLAIHLPILASVAQATAYAHAHGVIHRDIKPGQVMVGDYGETFLTDWGLAVRLAELAPGAPGEVRTPIVCPAGTAAYMAPEQTDLTPGRLGPWTDVYLLGGTLYTLLTGLTPHPGSSSGTAFQLARRGLVPPISEAAGEREIPAELAALAEWCLSPEPAARPASARVFIQELQSFISGTGRRRESESLLAQAEQSLAGPAVSYRDFGDVLALLDRSRALWPANPGLDAVADRALVAWTRTALAAGDLALARTQADRVRDTEVREALLLDTETATRQLVRERRQRRWAMAAAAVLFVAFGIGALVHLRSVAAARDRAERALRAEATARSQVTGLLSFLLGDLRESLAPIGRLSILERVADQAFEQLRQSPPQEEDVALTLRARALETLGDVLTARGSEAEAATAWRDALAIREGLAARHPADPDRQRELALSLVSVGRGLRAEGDLTGALGFTRRAVAIRDRLAQEGGGTAVDWERDRAADHHIEADLLQASGDLDAALAKHREALAILEACVVRAPGDVDARRDRAVSHSRVGDLLAAQDDPRAALAEYRAYAAEIAMLRAQDPHHAGLTRELATAHNSVGWAQRALGNPSAALTELLLQRDLMIGLVERDATNVAWRRDLAQCRAAAGQVLASLGRRSEARAELEAAAAEMEVIAAADAANRGAQRDAAVARGLVAKHLADSGHLADAAEALRGPLAAMERLAASDPDNARWQADLARLREWQAQVTAARAHRR